MTDLLEAPPPPPRLLGSCLVDHDQLPPRTAVLPGRRHGAQITYWTCPHCTYYFTSITAAPDKKVTMANITIHDQLTIVKALARPTAMGLVIAANPHLTKLQVETIAADHGHPRINDLREAMGRLQRQADKERMDAAIPTGKTTADEATARQARPVAAVQQPTVTLPPQAPQPPDETTAVLAAAHQSTSKRTAALADKIEALIADLKQRTHAETQAVRDAQKRDRERQEALAEVAKAEEALRIAREKARRYKNHPGGNGRATTTRTPSSESRQPGGLAARPHLAIADIRAWANTEGLNPGRGSRIARTILDAYETAHLEGAIA